MGTATRNEGRRKALLGALLALPLVLMGCRGTPGGPAGDPDGGTALRDPRVEVEGLALTDPGEEPGVRIAYRVLGSGSGAVELTVDLELEVQGFEDVVESLGPETLAVPGARWQRGEVLVPLQGLPEDEPEPGIYMATLTVVDPSDPERTDFDSHRQAFSADLDVVEVLRDDAQLHVTMRNRGSMATGLLSIRFTRLDAAGGEELEQSDWDPISPEGELELSFDLAEDEAARLVLADHRGQVLVGPLAFSDGRGDPDPRSPNVALAELREVAPHSPEVFVLAEVELSGAPLDCRQGCGEVALTAIVDGQPRPEQVWPLDLPATRSYMFSVPLDGLAEDVGHDLHVVAEVRGVPGEQVLDDNRAELQLTAGGGTTPYPDGPATSVPAVHAAARIGEAGVADAGMETGLWIDYELVRSTRTAMPEAVQVEVASASRSDLGARGGRLGEGSEVPAAPTRGARRFPLFVANDSDLFGARVELQLEVTLRYPEDGEGEGPRGDHRVTVPVTLTLPESPLPEVGVEVQWAGRPWKDGDAVHPGELGALAVLVRNQGGADLRQGRVRAEATLITRDGERYQVLDTDQDFDALRAGGEALRLTPEHRPRETWTCHDDRVGGWPRVPTETPATIEAVVRVTQGMREQVEEARLEVVLGQISGGSCGGQP